MLVEADLVELGKAVVVARHRGVLLYDSILVDEDFHVRRATLTLESNLHRLAGSEVAAPGERCADEENPLLAGVRDRDSVVPARLATDDIHGDQAVAHDPA